MKDEFWAIGYGLIRKARLKDIDDVVASDEVNVVTL